MQGGITKVEKRPRRTQEERSAATIAKLLDATIESLIEVGYEQTTSRTVAERAGVSRGAQSHHFPRRVDLIVSAVERMDGLQSITTLEELRELPDDDGLLRAVIDSLWRSYTSPLFTALVKLWVAAQDDPELYERLIPIEREMSRSMVANANALLDGSQQGRELLRGFPVVVSTIRGWALMHAFEPRHTERDDPWPHHRDVLVRMLSE